MSTDTSSAAADPTPGPRAIDAAEARIRAVVPIARVIRLESDLRRPQTPERSGATTAVRD